MFFFFFFCFVLFFLSLYFLFGPFFCGALYIMFYLGFALFALFVWIRDGQNVMDGPYLDSFLLIVRGGLPRVSDTVFEIAQFRGEWKR